MAGLGDWECTGGGGDLLGCAVGSQVDCRDANVLRSDTGPKTELSRVGDLLVFGCLYLFSFASLLSLVERFSDVCVCERESVVGSQEWSKFRAIYLVTQYEKGGWVSVPTGILTEHVPFPISLFDNFWSTGKT